VSGCAAACSAPLRANGVCDWDACGSRQCGFDYEGRCCPEACDALWQDGICQPSCNSTECGYDGGDCCDTNSAVVAACLSTRADGVCDAACDLPQCGHDGGDCAVDRGLAWGGYDLAEQLGFDGRSKGGVGLVIVDNPNPNPNPFP
jgi:hypothetical protein